MASTWIEEIRNQLPHRLILMNLGLANGQFPRILYKYTTTDTLKLILKNAVLKFSKISEFNDKKECFAILDFKCTPDEWCHYIKGINPEMPQAFIKKMARDLQQKPELGKQWIARAIKDTNEHLGILCMTSSNQNELMWAHYADSHRGVCIEFDLGKSIETFCFPKKVEYSDDTKRFNYIRSWVERKGMDATEAIYHKSSKWEYEEEYRVVRVDGAGFIPFNKESLCSICFGIDTPEETINEIKTLCCDNGYGHIQFLRNTLDDESGEYRIVSINCERN